MGCFPAKPANQKPNPGAKTSSEVKLLLLGSGESGKSTFFKQIKIIHNKGYSESEKIQFKSSIFANILQTIKALAECVIKAPDLEFEKPDSMERAERIMKLTESNNNLLIYASKKYNDDVANDVQALWEDGAIKKAFEYRYNFHVFDGADYFFSKLDELRPPEKYVPSSEDILRCRRKTTGIIELEFSLGNAKFNIVDVGGQRNERKKWIHCFENVGAMIFVASLGDYDQKCYEDDETNRMIESLDLFDEMVNNNYFKHKPVILFLNKTDIFKKKIDKVKLSEYFEDYDGGNDCDKAIDFIVKKYMEVRKFESSRIYTHCTCATDRESVEKVLQQLKQDLIDCNVVSSTPV